MKKKKHKIEKELKEIAIEQYCEQEKKKEIKGIPGNEESDLCLKLKKNSS